jgi:hypothetical protein
MIRQIFAVNIIKEWCNEQLQETTMELDRQEQGIMTVNQISQNITRKLSEGLLCV